MYEGAVLTFYIRLYTKTAEHWHWFYLGVTCDKGREYVWCLLHGDIGWDWKPCKDPHLICSIGAHRHPQGYEIGQSYVFRKLMMIQPAMIGLRARLSWRVCPSTARRLLQWCGSLILMIFSSCLLEANRQLSKCSWSFARQHKRWPSSVTWTWFICWLLCRLPAVVPKCIYSGHMSNWKFCIFRSNRLDINTSLLLPWLQRSKASELPNSERSDGFELPPCSQI